MQLLLTRSLTRHLELHQDGNDIFSPFHYPFPGAFCPVCLPLLTFSNFCACFPCRGALMNSIGILFGGILGVVLDHVQVEICMAMLSRYIVVCSL